MQIRPFLVKLGLKSRAWRTKYRLRVRPVTTEEFFRNHWIGRLPSADYFVNRSTSSFFFDAREKDKYTSALRQRFHQSDAEIKISVDKICLNKFDLLGSGETCLGAEISWQKDFKSGFEWPLDHYTEIQIVDLTNSADVKIPWELSRLQCLTTLGRAYWITGSPKYASKFTSITSDWIINNPIDYGVNWTCSMEVAIRAINMIWGMNFFANQDELTESFVKQIIRSLYYHGLHIERNLEITGKGANSNHLLSNYLGLFYIGLLFPEFDKSKKWLKIGKDGLEQEIMLQVHQDGADYECSLSYHRLVLEMFLSALILGKANQCEFSNAFSERLTRMIEFSAAMTSQSGETPAIGDNDDGFIVKLANENPHDHRALIDIGAAILNIKITENVEVTEERLWYLAPVSLLFWPPTIRRKPQLFKDSGLAVIQNERVHLVFNANDISEKAFGGHKHNDLLSLCLQIDSVPFLIDAGTACYTSDYQLRNKSRSTGMHNTIRIDNDEQNRFLERKLFFMFRDARPKIDLWTVTDNIVIVSGFHNGYSRFGASLIHRRTLEVSFPEKSIVIWDEITGEGTEDHLIESNWLTPLACHREKNALESMIDGPYGKSLHFSFVSSSDLHLHAVPMEYYPRYGTSERGTQISCRCRTKLPFRLETRLIYGPTASPTETLHRFLEFQRSM